jgi:hypothetical protein
VVRSRLARQQGAFNLGRFELPVAITALIWVIVALFVLVVPGEALVPDLIVVGLLLAGGLFQVGLLIFNRQAFETEPVARWPSTPSGPEPPLTRTRSRVEQAHPRAPARSIRDARRCT